MRIAHISDCYLPRLGGIEVQVRTTAIAQTERGDAVTVITATPGTSDPDPGIDVARIDAHLPFETPVHPRGISLIREALQRSRPDVVHIHAGVVSPFAWMGIAAARGLPTVVTVHSMWGPIAQRGFAPLARTEPSFVTTAVSKVAADLVAETIGADVLVTPNAIDPTPWQQRGRVEHAGVHIVATLRFAPRKRVMSLLRALRDARRWVPHDIEMRATIAGDGPLMPQARKNVIDHGMDWVALPGRMSRDELAMLYSSADVFVQPTVRESFGLAALEARAAGLPIIGMAGSGLTEFVTDDVNGLLVHGDASLSAAIRRLVVDPDLRARFSSHNREHPVIHTWEYALDALDRAYASARSRH